MAAHMRAVTFASRSYTELAHKQSRCIHTNHLNRTLSEISSRPLSRYLHRRKAVIGVLVARNASTAGVNTMPTGYVPDVPVTLDVPSIPLAPDPSLVDLPLLNGLGEPTMASMGLGKMYTPVGLWQNLLDYIHVTLDIPWWGTISLLVVTTRILLIPLMIKQRKATMNLQNHLPTMTRLQERCNMARKVGDVMEVQRRTGDLQQFMQRNDVSIFKTLSLTVVQLPIMLTSFISLRSMGNAHVESLTTGGFGWVTDLTMADPLYILPIITGSSLLLMIELGVDMQKAADQKHHVKWLMRASIPLMIFITSSQPAAVALYWAINNVVSLIISQAFKLQSVKTYCGFPETIKHDQTKSGKSKKFIEGFKDMYDNNKVTRAVQARRQADEAEFKNAGTGPVPKTYAHKPVVKRKNTASL